MAEYISYNDANEILSDYASDIKDRIKIVRSDDLPVFGQSSGDPYINQYNEGKRPVIYLYNGRANIFYKMEKKYVTLYKYMGDDSKEYYIKNQDTVAGIGDRLYTYDTERNIFVESLYYVSKVNSNNKKYAQNENNNTASGITLTYQGTNKLGYYFSWIGINNIFSDSIAPTVENVYNWAEDTTFFFTGDSQNRWFKPNCFYKLKKKRYDKSSFYVYRGTTIYYTNGTTVGSEVYNVTPLLLEKIGVITETDTYDPQTGANKVKIKFDWNSEEESGWYYQQSYNEDANAAYKTHMYWWEELLVNNDKEILPIIYNTNDLPKIIDLINENKPNDYYKFLYMGENDYGNFCKGSIYTYKVPEKKSFKAFKNGSSVYYTLEETPAIIDPVFERDFKTISLTTIYYQDLSFKVIEQVTGTGLNTKIVIDNREYSRDSSLDGTFYIYDVPHWEAINPNSFGQKGNSINNTSSSIRIMRASNRCDDNPRLDMGDLFPTSHSAQLIHVKYDNMDDNHANPNRYVRGANAGATIFGAIQHVNSYMNGDGVGALCGGKACDAGAIKASYGGSFAHGRAYNGGDLVAGAPGAHAEGCCTYAGGYDSHAEGRYTSAEGSHSHAEGVNSKAQRNSCHAEGRYTIAAGSKEDDDPYETISSHAEGHYSEALGFAAHAEGAHTYAIKFAHAEGKSTRATGDCSHAEGYETKVRQNYGHAEGYLTHVNDEYGHAEGYRSSTAGNGGAHAEGIDNHVCGQASHIEGMNNSSYGVATHMEGYQNYKPDSNSCVGSHIEGGYNNYTINKGNYSHIEGKGNDFTGGANNYSGSGTHIEGGLNTACAIDSRENNARYAHVEGFYNWLSGNYAHVEGAHCTSRGVASHSEGFHSKTNGSYQYDNNYPESSAGAHAEGFHTQASYIGAHSEGVRTRANGNKIYTDELTSTTYWVSGGHAEGIETASQGTAAHAEGIKTEALAEAAHAEGKKTSAYNCGHAEGFSTVSLGAGAHAGGTGTRDQNNYYTVSAENKAAFAHGYLASDNVSNSIGEVKAGGVASVALGYSANKINNGSGTAYGLYAGGTASIALGNNTVANENNEVVIGWLQFRKS